MITNTTEIIDRNLFRLISSVARTAGVRVYVVGPYVRDFFIGRTCNSIDVVVEGNSIEFAHVLGDKLHSRVSFFKNYGTATLRYRGDCIQFSGDRRLLQSSESKKYIYGKDALDDYQQHAGITINAIAISLNEDDFGRLIDPFGGIVDLSRGIINTVVQADELIKRDAIIMIKAIRLVTQISNRSLLFHVAPQCLEAIRRNATRVESLPKEKIYEEINKILLCDAPSSAISLLEQVGILKLLIKPLSATNGVEKRDGLGYEDSFPHTLKVLDNLVKLERNQSSDSINTLGIKQGDKNLWLRWAALLHDIGKPVVKQFSPDKGWSFHGYDVVGAKMIPQIFSSLKMPLNDTMRYVQKLISLQCRPKALLDKGTSESAYRRLLFDAGDDIEDLMLLCVANITTTNKDKAEKALSEMKGVRQKLLELKADDSVRFFKNPISANYIMDLYGLEPCNLLGVLKEYIKQAILNGEIQNSFEEAEALLKKKASEMGLICLNKNLSTNITD